MFINFMKYKCFLFHLSLFCTWIYMEYLKVMQLRLKYIAMDVLGIAIINTSILVIFHTECVSTTM